MTAYYKEKYSAGDEFCAMWFFTWMTCCTSVTTVAVMISMTFVSIHIFTLGSFNNFLALQNLTSP